MAKIDDGDDDNSKEKVSSCHVELQHVRVEREVQCKNTSLDSSGPLVDKWGNILKIVR